MNESLYPYLILGAAVFHVIEEFVYPGGFLDWMKNAVLRFKRMNLVKGVDSGMAVLVNALFILLCVVNLIYYTPGSSLLYLVTGLILFNGMLHIGSSFVFRKYAPGLLTSVLMYIPVSIYIIYNAGPLSGRIISALISGALLHIIPLIVIFTKSRFVNHKSNPV
jgi:hypothetical protein